ncbi:MAG: FliH/SctL family protein, partial [Gammaproteobacteria bacterium]|nr:FliH/SctL family protein [Gammaproteobacteria bacterium]
MSRDVINKGGEAHTLWDLPIVSEGDSPTVVAVAENLMPTAESIQEIQDQAYKEAYEAAFSKAEQEGLAQGKKAGHEQGFAEGKKEGFDLGIAEGQEVIKLKSDQFSSLITMLQSPLEQLDKEVEDELMYLVMTISRHVIRREVKL